MSDRTPTPEDLGRMIARDLRDRRLLHDDSLDPSMDWPEGCEDTEDLAAHLIGEHVRAQVRAALGPLLDEDDVFNNFGWNRALHAAARAILGLAPDAPPPLEDSE